MMFVTYSLFLMVT